MNIPQNSKPLPPKGSPGRKKYDELTNDLNKALANPNPMVQKLAAQIAGQREKIRVMGGKVPPSHHKSLFGKTMDILSRGQYATASFILEGAKKKKDGTLDLWNADPVAAAKGFWHGLSGHHKADYAEVMKQLDKSTGGKTVLHNRVVQAVGGLAGDIALDPTTYVGLGVAKDAGVAEKTINEAKDVAKSVDAFKASKEAEQVANKFKLDAALSKIKGGSAVKLTDKQLEKAVAEHVNRVALDKAMGEASAKAAIEGVAKKGSIDFKLLGHKVAGSEHAYEALSKLGKVGKDNKYLADLAEKFRPTFTFREGTNFMKRKAENWGVHNFQNFLRVDDWDKIAKHLTADEAAMITKARESGADLSHIFMEKDPGRSLKEVQDIAYKKLDTLGVDEEAAKLIREGRSLENYVPHYYNPGENADLKKVGDRFNRMRRTWEEGKKIPSILDAEKAGLKPELDIRKIINRRTAESFQQRAQQGFLKEALAKFGIDAADKGASEALKKKFPDLVDFSHRLLPGESHLIPKEIERSLKGVDKVFNNPEPVMNLMDKAVAQWKFFATVPNPGHHIRNVLGDVWNNFLDGVVDPRAYERGVKMLTQKGEIALGEGKKIAASDAFEMFTRHGGKQGWYHNLATGKRGIQDTLRAGAEHREDFTRAAHFVDALKDELKGVKYSAKSWHDELDAAAERAGQRVMHWNIDYGDLTDFEKNIGKRVIPFYTWMRKNIPLQIEAMMLHPGRVAVAPKGMAAVQRILGEDPRNAAPGLVFPQWLSEMQGVPINSDAASPLGLAPGLPLYDLGQFDPYKGLQGNLAQLLSTTTPLIRAPIELGMGRSIYSGAPIPSNTQYAEDLVPMARVAGQFLNRNKNTQLPTESPQNNDFMVKLINYLTGAGLYKITPKRQLSELRRQQDPVQMEIARLRQKAIRDVYKR